MADEVARLLRVHWLRALDEPSAAGMAADKDDLADLAPPSAATGVAVDAEDEEEGSVAASSAASNAPPVDLDPLVADRFKLMSPQTPYHLFVAGKVQAARLKQAVTAQARMDVDDGDDDAAAARDDTGDDSMDDVADADAVAAEAVRRINRIWDAHARDADAAAITARLDDIIAALEYCQLFWYSLNFAEHLKHLKAEASKPLLHGVYRE
ncbi:hypothetical protein LPJ73_008827 [Coemansia sp. RSA 2703]|nr:hypothetical protein LPJ73_008827 [Coemansia sp. RSA 2703]